MADLDRAPSTPKGNLLGYCIPQSSFLIVQLTESLCYRLQPSMERRGAGCSGRMDLIRGAAWTSDRKKQTYN